MIDKNKTRYIDLCRNKSIPLFSQFYWMDAVCGPENWGVIFAEENGNIQGSLVYYIEILENSKIIRKAPLTQNNGIIYYYPDNIKYDRKLSFEEKVSNNIINQIEAMDIDEFRQYFHFSFTNWLPFYWRGYSQTTRYTYRIENINDLTCIDTNLSGKIRTRIRKAQKIVSVKQGMNSKTFYDLNTKVFKRQGIKTPYTFEIFDNLYNTLKNEGRLYIFYAEDLEKKIHAAAFFAHDDDTFYYLMAGVDDEYRHSQALTLLIYTGIRKARELNLNFDFEGSMKKNIENSFRQYGATQVQYFDIRKSF